MLFGLNSPEKGSMVKIEELPSIHNAAVTTTLGHRNVVADENLGDGATFWKLLLALIGSCRQNKYCHQ